MIRYVLHSAAAGVLILALVPTFLLTAPRPAHALFGVGDIVHDPLNFIQLAADKAIDFLTSGLTDKIVLKEYTLDGIAWSLGQQLIQSLTANVVNWINGKNGGGFSLFVQNLPNHLLNVGDVQALAFFNEFGQSNSPFATVILSSLRTNYLQSTSAAGFWAANRCTLSQYAQDPLAFVGGNFNGQGGWGSWFALNQPSNNPYLLYYRSQGELNGRIGYAQNNALTQLNWGQGFMSWCGTDTDAGSQQNSQQQYLDTATANTAYSAVALGPRTCTDSHGNPGSIQTPGSVIHDQLSKALGTTFDRLVSSDELDEVVSALVQRLITTVTGDSGLAGASRSSGVSRPLVDQIGSQNNLADPTVSNALTAKTTLITSYQSAWQTIGNAARVAKTSVDQLQSSCPSTAADVQSAITTEINPVLDQALASDSTTTAAQAEVNRLRTSKDPVALQKLLTSTPTATDVAQVQNDAQTTGLATASSNTSLAVSGGSIVDQMNLIATNANNARQTCLLPHFIGL